MAWTSDDLARIETAIASGTTRVKFKDREVQYASLSELMSVRNIMRADLNVGGKKQLPASYDNDL